MKRKVNGIEINYRDEGAGIPVVLIHAFPLNQDMWDEQVEALKSSYRTITLDLRGFGRSEVPEGPYFMDQMAADVRGLLTGLKLDRAVLVGLSMGGYISLAFCRNYPDSVRALVLADTRADADSSEGRERRFKSAEKAEREGSLAIAEDMIGIALASSTKAARPGIADRIGSIVAANSPRGLAAAQRGMAERPDSSDVLSQIACPTLVIVGSEDQLTPVSEAERLSKGIESAELRVIEGAGHFSSLERPEEFNSALLEWLKRRF